MIPMFPHDRRAQVKKILGGGGDKIIRRCAKGFPVALIWGGVPVADEISGAGDYYTDSVRLGSVRFDSVRLTL